MAFAFFSMFSLFRTSKNSRHYIQCFQSMFPLAFPCSLTANSY